MVYLIPSGYPHYESKGVPHSSKGVPHSSKGVPHSSKGVPHSSKSVSHSSKSVFHSSKSVSHSSKMYSPFLLLSKLILNIFTLIYFTFEVQEKLLYIKIQKDF